MSPNVHRAALLATARVAMCGSLVALGGCTGGKSPEAVTPPDAVVPADGAAPADMAGRVDPAPPADPAACPTLVEAAWDDKGERVNKDDAAVASCCDHMAKGFDGNLDEGYKWADRSECCKLLGWQGSATCTPWGPPTPPEMA